MLSDAYYYSSLAESLILTGKLYSLTSEPPNPVVTTQNGIAFIHSIIIYLGVDDIRVRMLGIGCINLLAMIISFVVLRKTFKKVFKINEVSIALILLAIILNTKWILSAIQPINDMLFMLLSYCNDIQKEIISRVLYL